jgi:hypothetical protein
MEENLPKKVSEIVYEYDTEGKLLGIDSLTGEVVAAEEGSAITPGGVFIPEFSKNSRWTYHPAICEIIFKELSKPEGKLSKICDGKKLPPLYTVYRWRKEYEELDRAISLGRQARAETLHDEMLEDTKSIKEEEGDISGQELQVKKHVYERLKYLAAVNDPNTYGNRTKVSGDSDQPVNIVISTGVRNGKEHD